MFDCMCCVCICECECHAHMRRPEEDGYLSDTVQSDRLACKHRRAICLRPHAEVTSGLASAWWSDLNSGWCLTHWVLYFGCLKMVNFTIRLHHQNCRLTLIYSGEVGGGSCLLVLVRSPKLMLASVHEVSFCLRSTSAVCCNIRVGLISGNIHTNCANSPGGKFGRVSLLLSLGGESSQETGPPTAALRG